MLIVGLTGGIACGKSLAAKYFQQLGVPVIDADAIALSLTSSDSLPFKQIHQHFGDKIIDQHGELNRRKLREIIFNNEVERLWLENLLHPLILTKIQQQTNLLNTHYCIWMIPLLIEKNIKVDRVLVIDCPEELQIERLKLRDKMNDAQIAAILKTQLTRIQRLEKADDVIENRSNESELQQQVLQQHGKYCI